MWEILLTGAVRDGAGALLAWWLFGRLLRPVPGQAAVAVLVAGQGDGEGLEQTRARP